MQQHEGMEIAQWVLRFALAITFTVVGIGHFVPRVTLTMAAMMPPRLRLRFPTPTQVVWFTGACELAGAIGLLLPWTRVAAGVCLVAYLIAVVPANAYAARHPERFGRVAVPFWPRLAAQVVLIALVILAILPLTAS
jgi:uncharacterized membrane protein